MIDSLAAYVPLAIRTESLAAEGWRGAIPRDLYRVNHALIGLVTETGELLEALSLDEHGDEELDWVNIHEELGDLWWYSALLIDQLAPQVAAEFDDDPPDLEGVGYQVDEDFDQDDVELLTTTEAHGSLATLVALAGRGLDVVKRRLYYGAGDDSPKSSWDLVPVARIVDLLAELTRLLQAERSAIWSANIAKLATRYPDAFASDAALIRDLGAERKVLEG